MVHTNFGGNSYGPIVLKVLQKFPPTLVLVHGWLFPDSLRCAPQAHSGVAKVLVQKRIFRAATSQNLVVKFGGEICGGALVENASDDFPQRGKLENILPNFARSSPPISPTTSPTSLWKSLRILGEPKWGLTNITWPQLGPFFCTSVSPINGH